jgi:hypothetical protein
MFDPLYRYILKHKQLSLAGIGTITMQAEPAQSDFVNRSFLPARYSFVFEQGREVTSRRLFSWLSSALEISERDAIIRFNDFVFEIKRQIESGTEVAWQGIGKLKKGLAGEIKFNAYSSSLLFPQPVIAEKVIREHAEHTMLVGEVEKTSTEMTGLLSQGDKRKISWWIIPLAIIILLIIFIGWYFSEHGINTGNNHTILP